MRGEHQEINGGERVLIYRPHTPDEAPLRRYWRHKAEISPWIFNKDTLIGGGWVYDLALERDPFQVDPIEAEKKDVDPFGFKTVHGRSTYCDISLPSTVVNTHLIRVTLWDLGEVNCPDLELKTALDIFALEDVRDKQIGRLITAVLSEKFQVSAFCEIIASSRVQGKRLMLKSVQPIIQEIIDATRVNPQNVHLLYCLKDPVCYKGILLQRQSGKLLPDNLIDSAQDLNRQNFTVRVFCTLLGLGFPTDEASFYATTLGENSWFIQHVLECSLTEPMLAMEDMGARRNYLAGLKKHADGNEPILSSIAAESPREMIDVLSAGAGISGGTVDEFFNILGEKATYSGRPNYRRDLQILRELGATREQRRRLFLRYHRLLGSKQSKEAEFFMHDLRSSSHWAVDSGSFQAYIDYLLRVDDSTFIEFSFINRHRDNLPPELTGLFDFSRPYVLHKGNR